MYNSEQIQEIEKKISELMKCPFVFVKFSKTKSTLVFSGVIEKNGARWNVNFEIENCDLEEDWSEKEWVCDFSPGEELLQKVQERIEEMDLEVWNGKIIHGFKLTRSKSVTNYKGRKIDDKYYKWQAYKTINGKRHCVHVGKRPELAEEKILLYLAEHPEIKEAAIAK